MEDIMEARKQRQLKAVGHLIDDGGDAVGAEEAWLELALGDY